MNTITLKCEIHTPMFAGSAIPGMCESNFQNSQHTKYPHLTISFNTPISPQEIPYLRAAIVAKVGRQHAFFHNHDADGSKVHRYPLIQYKRFGERAGLVAIGDGVEAVQAFLNLRDRSLDLGGRRVVMDVDRMQVRHQPLRVWDTWFSYRVTDWIALHGAHLQAYKNEPSLGRRIGLLERKLNSNIRSFTRAVGWSGDGQVEVRIHHLRNAENVLFKDIYFRAFEVEFSTNVLLPSHIGFGKGSAFGFGTITPNPRKQ
jgi:Cas6b C-terminal domain/Cas6b N-terminal domain